MSTSTTIAVAPDPADYLIAGLHLKLQRLFTGVKVKRLAGHRRTSQDGTRGPCEWIGLTFFGPEPVLLRFGLLRSDLLAKVPRSGTKYFRNRKATDPTSMKRGKTGTSVNFSWHLALGEHDCDLKDAPIWIRSELLQLTQIGREVAEAAKPKPLPLTQKSPEEVWQSAARSALFLLSGLIPDKDGLVDADSILAANSPLKKHEGAMDIVAVHLKRIASEPIKSSEVEPAMQTRRHLRLVISNT